MLLTFTQLRERLGVSAPTLTGWVKRGLPFTLEKRSKRFDGGQVRDWLIDHGVAKEESRAPDQVGGESPEPEKIATTRGETAAHFGVSVRTIADWQRDEGFPGRPGSPGRQDGYYPLGKIETWLRDREALLGSLDSNAPSAAGGAGSRNAFWHVKAQRAQLELERELGTILDVEETAAFLERLVATARAMLESLPDKVVALLPPDVPDSVRSAVHQSVNQQLDAAYEILEELTRADADDDEAHQGPHDE